MKHLKLLISVIIVAYRSEKYINPCIDSIRASARYANLQLEVIVVINDSKNKLYKLPKGVKVKRSLKNIGYAAGINTGAKYARGEWLLVANPDTVTDKKALFYLSRHFKNKKIAIVGPKIIHPDGSVQLTINKLPSLWQVFLEQSYLYKIYPFSRLSPKAYLRQYTYTHEVEALEGTYLLIRKKYFDAVGGMDERFFLYFEDMDLCKRLNVKGLIILFEPNMQIKHTQSLSSEGSMIAKNYAQSILRFFLKYYSKLNANNAVNLLILGSIFRSNFWIIKRKFLRDKGLLKKTILMEKYYNQLTKTCYKDFSHRYRYL